MSGVDAPSRRLVRFGVFELDLQGGELRRQGIRVRLQEQPLLVLRALVERPGQVVAREELRSRIWPADTYVEFDQGVYSALARLREALGDTAVNPRFVETVPRRGYRFVAPVEVVPAEPAVAGQTLARSASRRRVPTRAAALVALGACVGLAFFFAVRGGLVRSKPDVPAVRALAVLPLANLSGDPAREYVGDGMTDELITDLALLGTVQVVSRTSVMRFKGSNAPLPQIARELHVDAIVEGSYRCSGQRVRVAARLIDASSGRLVWTRVFEGDLGDGLALQSELAGAIVSGVKGELVSDHRSPRVEH